MANLPYDTLVLFPDEHPTHELEERRDYIVALRDGAGCTCNEHREELERIETELKGRKTIVKRHHKS